MAPSNKSTEFEKLSLSMPDILTVTSILGLFSSSSGIISNPFTLPFF